MSKQITFKNAVVHGRFQPFHYGHLKYIISALNYTQNLIIGVDSQVINKLIIKNNYRYLPMSNPFTFIERYLMIKRSLLDYGLTNNSFRIFHMPLDNIKKLLSFFPENIPFLMPVYDDSSQEKITLLKKANINVVILWKGTNTDRPISGSLIRQKIFRNEDIDDLVTPSALNIINNIKLTQRIF